MSEEKSSWKRISSDSGSTGVDVFEVEHGTFYRVTGPGFPQHIEFARHRDDRLQALLDGVSSLMIRLAEQVPFWLDAAASRVAEQIAARTPQHDAAGVDASRGTDKTLPMSTAAPHTSWVRITPETPRPGDQARCAVAWFDQEDGREHFAAVTHLANVYECWRVDDLGYDEPRFVGFDAYDRFCVLPD